ncbi:MAG: flagellar filament capping protein FliD [Nitrospirota bacterium]|nr:flagellar filament capping protein FliD [Nitrospirota bacterium]
MSVIASVGLSSGINYDQLINNLLNIQRLPLYRFQNKQAGYNDKISVYNELSAKLSTFMSAADTLKSESSFYVKTSSVSDSSVFEATVSNSAATGNYSVIITALASGEKEVHSGVASSTTVVNDSGADQSFQYTYAGTQSTLTVTDGTTLEGLRDLINNDTGNPGITATLLYDGSSYRLVLTGDDTGSTNTVTIDAGTTIDGVNTTVDLTSTTFTETKTASDASFSVDGISMTRSSNTVTDAMTGVTLTLKNAGSATLSVTNDTDTISQNVQSFVDAYNDIVSYVSANSAYNANSHVGNPLFGESTSRLILNRLSSIITNRASGLPEDLRALSQLGVSTNRDGTLSLDTGTLGSKLSTDLGGVENLFTDSTSGIAIQLYNYIDDATDSIDGAITIRIDGLESLVGDISDDILDLEAKLSRTEESLRRQFSALESLLSGLTSQSTFLTNLTNVWNQ